MGQRVVFFCGDLPGADFGGSLELTTKRTNLLMTNLRLRERSKGQEAGKQVGRFPPFQRSQGGGARLLPSQWLLLADD